MRTLFGLPCLANNVDNTLINPVISWEEFERWWWRDKCYIIITLPIIFILARMPSYVQSRAISSLSEDSPEIVILVRLVDLYIIAFSWLKPYTINDFVLRLAGKSYEWLDMCYVQFLSFFNKFIRKINISLGYKNFIDDFDSLEVELDLLRRAEIYTHFEILLRYAFL